jgi:hypothetical protein
MKTAFASLSNLCRRPRAASAAASLLLAFAAMPAKSASAAEPIKVPLTADRWEAGDNVEFTQPDGYPLGVITVKKGSAVLKDLNFRNGTIEYDVQALASMGAGFGFRRRDDQTFEEFYLRPRPKCDEAPDCIQYAPQTHGVLLWDMFPQYQTHAPLKDGWNHIKIVVNGQRMNLYVNGATTPTLAVGRLEGDAEEGGILLQAPGSFANLVVIPDAVEGLSAEPLPDPTDADKRFVRNWQVAAKMPFPANSVPDIASLPGADAPDSNWKPISAERGGVIDLSRIYGLPKVRADGEFTWLKTTLTSNKAQTRKVSFGWNRQVWVYVNGKQVFADKNLYQPPSARKTPDGRLSLENGSFDLPLKAGKNEIAVALANDFYGWGIVMRLDDAKGLQLAAAAPAM